MDPLKVGESWGGLPPCRSRAKPRSRGRGRCRDWTGGTYRPVRPRVKGQSRPRTAPAVRGRRRKPKWDESWGRGFESRRGRQKPLRSRPPPSENPGMSAFGHPASVPEAPSPDPAAGLIGRRPLRAGRSFPCLRRSRHDRSRAAGRSGGAGSGRCAWAAARTPSVSSGCCKREASFFRAGRKSAFSSGRSGSRRPGRCAWHMATLRPAAAAGALTNVQRARPNSYSRMHITNAL